uniref:Ig-like domain-containing protein n=1 Tax=Glossina austeni TaxID=7395 RepID=A0A1A9VNU0_GLOAU
MLNLNVKNAPIQPHFDLTLCLRNVSVTIPTAVKRSDNAILICNYDIENDTLYSVKWYRGRREFYRYTPKENPAWKIFSLTNPGINVDYLMLSGCPSAVECNHIRSLLVDDIKDYRLKFGQTKPLINVEQKVYKVTLPLNGFVLQTIIVITAFGAESIETQNVSNDCGEYFVK